MAQEIVRRFVIEGEAAVVRKLPYYDGRPFRLLMDGRQVCCGTWSECERVALLMSRDFDLLTLGIACVEQEAWRERFREAEHRLADMTGGR